MTVRSIYHIIVPMPKGLKNIFTPFETKFVDINIVWCLHGSNYSYFERKALLSQLMSESLQV